MASEACKVCGYSGALRCIHQLSEREYIELLEGFTPRWFYYGAPWQLPEKTDGE